MQDCSGLQYDIQHAIFSNCLRKKTMEKKINSKIQKLIDRATNLDIDFDDFLQKYVIPKLKRADGSEVSFNFKKSHQIGRYFLCTGLAGPYAVGEEFNGRSIYIPLRGINALSIWEKERLIKILQEEGFFNEQ